MTKMGCAGSRQVWGMVVVGVLLTGCFGPKAIPTPAWNPQLAVEACMKQYDKNGDGTLDKKEYAASPALAAVPYWDTDGDKKLSSDEIRARVELYEQTKVNKQFMIRVLVNGAPAPDDTEVEFVPEDFLKDFIMPATGMPTPGVGDGTINMSTAGLPELVQVGLYRVKVKSPTLNISPEFNEETTLGLEVSPVTVAGQDGLKVFEVKAKRGK